VTIAWQSSPPFRRLPALLCAALALVASPLAAQSSVVFQRAAQFHATAGGVLLGEISAGTTLRGGPTQASWREVVLEAWIFSASLSVAQEGAFSHRVDVTGGENLRSAPNGRIIARALNQVFLTRLSVQGGWSRVRRQVWVPQASLAAAAQTTRAPAAAPAVVTMPPPPPPPPPSPLPAEMGVVREGAQLSLGPGSAEVGRAPEPLRVEVLSRSGGWTKVRADLWVREADVGTAPPPEGMLTLDQIITDPDKYIGARVTWRLQYLAIDTADELRPELPAGEPYLLTRGPLPESGFVYVAVTREQGERFRAMQSLQEFQAHGTIIAPRTRYLPIPVIRLEGTP